MIYLDNAATTPVSKPVLAEMLPYFEEEFGNPSSPHSVGKRAKEAVELARKRVAKSINAEPEQIFFTSGATESNNWVLCNYVSISPYEHPSLSNNPVTDFVFETVDDIKQNAQHLCRGFVYSHIWVNNVTGEIYNLKPFVETVHELHGYFHTDATQAFGHIPIDVKATNVDFLTLSGHKFHAPKGVGILYIKKPHELFKDDSQFLPMNFGGGQERGFRSGTENVASIVGMGKAAELYQWNQREFDRQWEMCDEIVDYIQRNIPKVHLYHKDFRQYETYGSANTFSVGYNVSWCVPNIIALDVQGVNGDDLMSLLDYHGVIVGTGSACSSNHPTDDTYGRGFIRISLSALTTFEDIEKALPILKECVEQARALHGE